jgi:EPS-associated MarR family transcriptional regulator
MKLSEKTFQVLDALDRREISSQRQLADHSGISLGQVNYILKSLLKKGLVKVDNFRKNPDKIGYVYLLTPKGIEAKSRLAARFVIRKIREYDEIRVRLTERLVEVEKTGQNRVLFLGPPIIKDLINNLIKENNLNIQMISSPSEPKDFPGLDSGSFDVVLLFDDDLEKVFSLGELPNIPRGKWLSLW